MNKLAILKVICEDGKQHDRLMIELGHIAAKTDFQFIIFPKQIEFITKEDFFKVADRLKREELNEN